MEQPQTQPKQGFTCTGDCLRCNIAQRQYCAAQFTYNSMRMLEQMQIAITDLTAKVEAIQGNEASIFDPTIATPTEQSENPLSRDNLETIT